MLIAALRFLLDSTARPLLVKQFGPDGSSVLNVIWERARQRFTTLGHEKSIGGALMVRLAAVTAAAYDTFRANGSTVEDAMQRTYDIAWAIYQKMGKAAWVVSSVAGRKNADRLRLATIAFRTFPFSAPSYGWKNISSSPDVVAFDCLKCPVADYFKTQQLSQLCVQTWCALDFPLASKVWHARLERSGSIAEGRSHCDFRWKAE